MLSSHAAPSHSTSIESESCRSSQGVVHAEVLSAKLQDTAKAGTLEAKNKEQKATFFKRKFKQALVSSGRMSAARRRRASSRSSLKTTATAMLALSPATTTGFVAPMPTNVRPNTQNSAISPLAWSSRPLNFARDCDRASGNHRASSIIMLEGSGFGRLLRAAGEANAGRAGAGSADIGARAECGSPNGSRRDRRASTAALKAVSNGNSGGYGGDDKRRTQQQRPSNEHNLRYAYGSSDSRPPGSGPPAGQGRGGGERPWRTAGDIPGLVLGVGLLVARHRRELRADKERRQMVSPSRVTTGDEEEETSSLFGAGLAGAGAGLRSRKAASARRSREGERADGDLELSRKWDEGEGEGDEEGEEAEWVEGQEEVTAEQEQLPYRRADTVTCFPDYFIQERV